jgi:hypothetical protein
MLEKGILFIMHKHYAVSKEPEKQTSTIDVSKVTVAPVLVLLRAGYIIGIFVLLNERCVHGNISKCRTHGSVRRWRQNGN